MQDPHDEARRLLVPGAELSDERQAWLQTHIGECEACRQYGEAAQELVRAFRSLPIAAAPSLVRATQMRVRFHSSRLREARERMWLVGISCLGVGLSASLTAPLLWGLFAWLGERVGISRPVWQASFVFVYIFPALLVSVLLLARGTYLKSGGRPAR